MFLRTLAVAAFVALLGPTAALAQDASPAPTMMASPMMGHHMKGHHMKGHHMKGSHMTGKHHHHHRHHKACRDAKTGKFVKCAKVMSATPSP